MRDDIDTEALRARLLERRAELEGLAHTRAAAGEVVELDQTRTGRLSRMDAMQAQAMARDGQRRASDELRRIDAALRRIEGGDFGYCVDCDEPITAGRLAADPSVALCVVCAERRGG